MHPTSTKINRLPQPQLPATYRTTQQPKNLPTDFLRQMFPSKVPEATYEFPSLTICPEDPGATLQIASCHVDKTVTRTDCDIKGTYPRSYTFEGETLNCSAVNDWPGSLAMAASNQDVLRITGNLYGTAWGSPEGILVAAHPQIPEGQQPTVDYENFFAVSAMSLTEVAAR